MQARKYQYGDLRIRKRKKGSDVWQFRYFDENGKRKSVIVGTVERLPTKADARRAIEGRRISLNATKEQAQFHSVTVAGLMDRFMQEYTPKHCRLNTRNNYQGVIDNHIRPRWGTEYIQNVRPMLVEAWLDDYAEYEAELRDGKKIIRSVSRAVKSHIRNLMHTIFQRAIFWEMLDRNPISLIHQSQKRLKKPRALMTQEFKLFVPQLAEPYKTIVIVHQCLGLRICETVAVQWGDINFDDLTIHVQRSFVRGEVNPVKTLESDSNLPLDPDPGHRPAGTQSTGALQGRCRLCICRAYWRDPLAGVNASGSLQTSRKTGGHRQGWLAHLQAYLLNAAPRTWCKASRPARTPTTRGQSHDDERLYPSRPRLDAGSSL